jgi:hypothetical protein
MLLGQRIAGLLKSLEHLLVLVATTAIEPFQALTALIG